MKRKEMIVCVAGVATGALLTGLFASPTGILSFSADTEHSITQTDDAYHVHADFLIYVNDTKLDMNREEFMTTNEQSLHSHAHLHDGNGEVLHLHEPGVTFADFLESLSIVLTEDCLTVENQTFCSTEELQLSLYVNKQPFTGTITEYEPMDDDAILLYYGAYDKDLITTYMNEVKDDACYYSGTCPERGVAPPESCGLTCEI
jgi:hypothetical protein